jgi:hypothetical protein
MFLGSEALWQTIWGVANLVTRDWWTFAPEPYGKLEVVLVMPETLASKEASYSAGSAL